MYSILYRLETYYIKVFHLHHLRLDIIHGHMVHCVEESLSLERALCVMLVQSSTHWQILQFADYSTKKDFSLAKYPDELAETEWQSARKRNFNSRPRLSFQQSGIGCCFNDAF